MLVDEGECAMKPTTKKVGLVIGVVGAILAAGVAVGALTNRGAPITRFDGVDEVIESCTFTTTYKNIPQMTKAFTVSGGTASVAVMFSGAFTLANNAAVRHRLLPAHDRRPAADAR